MAALISLDAAPEQRAAERPRSHPLENRRQPVVARGTGAASLLAVLRDEEARALFANRRAERRMAAELAALEDQLTALDKRLDATKRRLEAQWRHEHFGREPDRPPAWRHAPR